MGTTYKSILKRTLPSLKSQSYAAVLKTTKKSKSLQGSRPRQHQSKSPQRTITWYCSNSWLLSAAIH